MIGFGVGPMAFAPLSESVGRRPIYAITLFIAIIFLIPCAVAKNIGTLLVCRLIDGIAFRYTYLIPLSHTNLKLTQSTAHLWS